MIHNEHLMAVVDGKVVNSRQAVLPVTSISAQYAFSVYESVKVLHSHVVYAGEHIERLLRSAAGIGLKHPYTSTFIEESLDMIIRANGFSKASVRILICGGDENHLFITSSPLLVYPKEHYTKGIAVTTYEGERFLPQYKSSSLLMNYLALREARFKGAFEALLIDTRGFALEGTRSNFFALKENTFYTAGDADVLQGVTRSKILTAVETLGYNVSFTPVPASRLLDGSFDAFFLSSTSMGAMPIASVDGIAVPVEIDKIGSIHTLIRQWENDVLP